MARELFCRYDHCGYSCWVTAGMLPLICKGCKRSAKWNTEPVAPRTSEPRVPYLISLNDKRFLRSLHIKADEAAS